MPFTPTLAPTLSALALALFCNAALAAGTHAGGHGAAAIGQPGVAAKVQRSITVDMDDTMRYTPSTIQVGKGETIRLVVKNAGQVKHELSLGTRKELLAHMELMKKFPDMEHEEPNQITVAPGAQGEIIWQFTTAGTVEFACLMPGHFEAGMRGQVKVSGQAQTQVGQQADTSQMTEGEIRRVDKAAGKVTIKHAEIKSLDMPGMTMVFTARDKSQLDALQAGDKVKFSVVSEGGKMVLVEIQPAP